MAPKIIIRKESDADVSARGEVTAAAFKTLEISNHTEPFIIERCAPPRRSRYRSSQK